MEAFLTGVVAAVIVASVLLVGGATPMVAGQVAGLCLVAGLVFSGVFRAQKKTPPE